jgi:hypothetical protein
MEKYDTLVSGNYALKVKCFLNGVKENRVFITGDRVPTKENNLPSSLAIFGNASDFESRSNLVAVVKDDRLKEIIFRRNFKHKDLLCIDGDGELR